MTAPVIVPRCSTCAGGGCDRCAWTGAEPVVRDDRCPGCAQGWRECVCVLAAERRCPLDVAAGVEP